MKYLSHTSVLLLIVLIWGFTFYTVQSTKKVNCRKYVYAPVCRGVAAKRALPKLTNSIREPRESAILDFDAPALWKDKDSSEKGSLHLIIEKLKPKPDYTDNVENYSD